MIRRATRYLLLFIALMLLQLFVLNNIQLSGYINPYLYILVILLLPYQTPGWMLLGIGFLLGFTVDISLNTLGMHSSATLFMAFLRPYVLSTLSTADGVEKLGAPSMRLNGVAWSVRYTLILVFAHHLLLFYLEVFGFTGFFATLWRVVLSTLFTSFFLLMGQYLLHHRK